MIDVMSVTLALCLLTPQTGTVTVERTGTVADLLQEISGGSNVKLSAGRKEGQEILIVSLKGAPLSEAMKQIAWATFGQWEKDGKGGYKLTRDIAAERRAEREYIDKAAKIAADSIAKYREGVLRPGATDAEITQAALPRERNPYTQPVPAADARLMARLFANVNPRSLVRTDGEGFVTISSKPFGEQLSFGPQAEGILRQYLAEKGDELKLPPSDLPLRAVFQGQTTVRGGGGMLSLIRPNGQSLLGLIRRNVITFDAGPNVFDLPKEIKDAIPPEMLVPISEATKEFMAPKARSSEAIISRLQQPEKFEPLATYATDTWRAVASQTRRQLVANVSDSTLIPLIDNGSPTTLLYAMEHFYRDDMRFPKDWVLVRPQFPNQPWGHQINRAALGRFVRQSSKSGTLQDLEDGATLLTSPGVTTVSLAVSNYIGWARPFYGGKLQGEWDVYRFYGTLPTPLRRAWVEGTPIDVSTLSRESRRALGEWAKTGTPTSGWLRADRKAQEGLVLRNKNAVGFRDAWWDYRNAATFINAGQPLEVQPSTRTILRLYADFGVGIESPGKDLTDFTFNPNGYTHWAKTTGAVRENLEKAGAKFPAG